MSIPLTMFNVFFIRIFYDLTDIRRSWKFAWGFMIFCFIILGYTHAARATTESTTLQQKRQTLTQTYINRQHRGLQNLQGNTGQAPSEQTTPASYTGSSTYCNNPILATSLGSGPSYLSTDNNHNIYVSNNGTYVATDSQYIDAGLNKINSDKTISYFGDQTLEPSEITSSPNGDVYSINYTPSQSISKTTNSGTSSILTTYPANVVPQALQIDTSGTLYVAFLQGTVGGIDKIFPTGQHSTISTFPTPSTEVKLAIDSNHTLYASSNTSTGVSITAIDLSSGSQASYSLLGTNVASLISGVNGQMFALINSSQPTPQQRIVRLKQGVLSVVMTVPASRLIDRLTSSPSGLLYALDYLNNELLELNPNSSTIKALTLTSNTATDIAIDINGTVYFSNYEDRTIRQVDCTTMLQPQILTHALLNDLGYCTEVMWSIPMNCYFDISASSNYAIVLPATPIVASIEGQNSVSQTCAFLSNLTIYCYNIPTRNITTTGNYTINITISGETQSHCSTFLTGYFSNWTTDSQGSTALKPVITSFNNQLWEAVRGDDKKIYMRSSYDGQNFSAWQVDPISQTDYSVSLLSIHNTLFESSVGSGRKIYTRSTTDGVHWTLWTENGGVTNAPVALTDFNDKLIQAVKGDDGKIYTREYIPSQNNAWQTDPVGKTQQPIGMTSNDGKIWEAVRGEDMGVYVRFSSDMQNWSAWQNIGGSTNLEITLSSFKDRIFLSSVGTNGLIYSRYNGNFGWNDWTESGGVTTNGVSSTSFNNKFYQSIRGQDSKLYHRSLS